MLAAASTTSDTPHILVTFGGVLSEVDPCTEHATYVGMALIESIMNDVMDKRRTCDSNREYDCMTNNMYITCNTFTTSLPPSLPPFSMITHVEAGMLEYAHSPWKSILSLL